MAAFYLNLNALKEMYLEMLSATLSNLFGSQHAKYLVKIISQIHHQMETQTHIHTEKRVLNVYPSVHFNKDLFLANTKTYNLYFALNNWN